MVVTGAGGTIGGELARQVSDRNPAKLTLIDHSEYALYQIDLDIGERHPDLARTARIGDVREVAGIRRIFDDIKPEIVFHAAAMKHVPLMEANPLDAILTNIVGTRVVAEAATAAGAEAMVLISTDKAVNPTSVMGATKRVAEMVCQSLDRERVHPTSAAEGSQAANTRYVTVRFGNVLGSTGSVIPLFQRQLCARRTSDGDPSRDHPLFHDRARGGGACAPSIDNAGRRAGGWRRDLRAGYGRSGEDRRPRPSDDPACRAYAGP